MSQGNELVEDILKEIELLERGKISLPKTLGRAREETQTAHRNLGLVSASLTTTNRKTPEGAREVKASRARVRQESNAAALKVYRSHAQKRLRILLDSGLTLAQIKYGLTHMGKPLPRDAFGRRIKLIRTGEGMAGKVFSVQLGAAKAKRRK